MFFSSEKAIELFQSHWSNWIACSGLLWQQWLCHVRIGRVRLGMTGVLDTFDSSVPSFYVIFFYEILSVFPSIHGRNRTEKNSNYWRFQSNYMSSAYIWMQAANIHNRFIRIFNPQILLVFVWPQTDSFLFMAVPQWSLAQVPLWRVWPKAPICLKTRRRLCLITLQMWNYRQQKRPW